MLETFGILGLFAAWDREFLPSRHVERTGLSDIQCPGLPAAAGGLVRLELSGGGNGDLAGPLQQVCFGELIFMATLPNAGLRRNFIIASV